MSHRLIVLLVLAAAVAGCETASNEADDDGAAEESSAASEPWDTSASAGCDLVTDDEIRTALGEAVASKEEGGYYGCRWTTESILLDLRVFASTSLPADSCEENQQSMPFGQSPKGRVQTVTGLGDKAVWGSSGDLLVCTGRGLLVVNFDRSGPNMAPDAQREAAMLIAANALGRLEPGGP
jgi:hypothetical protein